MARNTLEAVFGALGAGLTGYGRDAARRREEQQAEIARQDELARTLAERQLRIFQSGLEEAAPATQRAQNVGQFGQMAQAAQGAMPAPMSAVGRALQSAGSGMQTDIQRGRRVAIGGTEYVQPFSRTAQGIEERELQRQAQQASIARQQELADEARRDAQRMREIAAQGENQLRAIERTANLRPPTPGEQNWRLRIPSASRQKLEQSESAMEQLAALRTAVRQNPSAVGFKAYAPGFIIDRRDPAGAAIRSTIELIAGEIRNARFGGALTKTEAEFAMRALPDATQRPDVLVSRIDALQQFLESRRRSVFNTYGAPYEPLVTTLESNDGSALANAGRMNVRGSAADRLRLGGYP